MPYVPLGSFAPDADPTQQGVLTDVDMMVPTLKGMKSMASEADAGIAACSSAVVSATSLVKLDGTSRVFAASATKLYEVSTASFGDVSRGSGTYSTGGVARWTFAQFQDTSLAAQKGDFIQKSASGAFADLTSAPQAQIVEVVRDFVFAFNTKDATYGDDPDRWWCSAAGDPTSWTANIATQATTGLLTDAPGPINAGKRLGSGVVAYKKRSMFLGQYIGAPLVWGWNQVPGEGLGTWAPYSVVDVQTAHLFIGFDDIYMYDGTRPVSIGTNRIAKYFFDLLNEKNASLIVGLHDRRNWLVYWWFPTGEAGTLDRFIVYNYRSDKWGAGIKTVNFAFEYLAAGISYNGLGTYYSTYADLPSSSYDEAFKATGSFLPATVTTSDKIATLTGTSGSSHYTTGDLGLDGVITLVDRARPRFISLPSVGTQSHFYHDSTETSVSTATVSSTLNSGRFDHVWAARWHRLKHAYTGDVEVTGIDITMREDGLE